MEKNVTHTTIESVRKMVADRNISCLMFKTEDRTKIILYSGTKMTFNSGLHTIHGHIKTATLDKEKNGNPFPGSYLRNNMFNEGRVLFRSGDYFSADNVKEHIASASNKIAMLMDSSVPLRELVTNGDCEVGEVPNIAHARRHFQDEDLARQFEEKPDLEGDLPLTFRKYDDDGVPIPDIEPITVNIVGRPDDILTKKKHYFIYSTDANYGKSTTFKKELVHNYKAIFIPHATNAMNIPPNVQFLIFDEFGSSKILNILDLQRMTGGDASDGALNRKSYGRSYTPRPDAQFIMLSNNSPYEVYATYDPITRRRVISEENYKTLKARFNIIRLDGPDLEKRTQFVPVDILSQTDYFALIRSCIYDGNVSYNERGTLTAYCIKRSLAKAYNVYKARQGGDQGNVNDFEIDLQESVPAVDLAMITNVSHIFKTYDSYDNSAPNFPVELSGHLPPQEALMFRARKRARRH